eukprot:8639551-Prorocentrum_lima.AAC.1
MLEYFAGVASVARGFVLAGLNATAFDLTYEHKEDLSLQDFCDARGFRYLLLAVRFSVHGAENGIVCTIWVLGS